jgi:hypothetical protein
MVLFTATQFTVIVSVNGFGNMRMDGLFASASGRARINPLLLNSADVESLK